MSQVALISPPLQRTAEVPFQTYKRRQAALARYRLYPLTVFYTLYAVLVSIIALSTTHPWTTVSFFAAGCVTWTFVEYLFHRYVLHGRFPPGKGLIRRFLHERLDPLHWDHHMRPFDGRHISGELKDCISRIHRFLFFAGSRNTTCTTTARKVLTAATASPPLSGTVFSIRDFRNPCAAP